MALALKLSTTVRNAMLDAIETAIGASAVVKIRTGSPPANCAAADTGTVLATITLGADWMSAAASGAKSMSGLPVSDSSADATGDAGHFRIYASNGTTCHMQGTAGTSDSDMILDNIAFNAGQPFSIVTFTLTDPHG